MRTVAGRIRTGALALAGLAAFAAASLLPAGTSAILMPALAAAALYVAFVIALRARVGDNLFGELGFIYLSLALAYILLPAVTFFLADLELTSGWFWAMLSNLLPSSADLGRHLWRLDLYLFGVAAGYLLMRGRRSPETAPGAAPPAPPRQAALALLAMIGGCAVAIQFLSAPVATYWDHYTRFDHLGWAGLRLAYLCLTLKAGGYYVLLALLFQQHSRNKWLTFALVPLFCIYETSYSLGSRIETLSILLGAGCLYHHYVKRLTFRKGALGLLAIAVLFSAIELLRIASFDLNAAQAAVAEGGAQPAGEFGAVYFTSFHLYAERAQGSLPPRDWPMFFNDLIALVPFLDHTQWHPQYWYWRHYFPEAPVPPQTLGPIAESALWGGEWDLLARSLVNGAFFAYLVRWFLKRRQAWWAAAIYAYLYATCVMTLKYSVFYQLTPLVRILLPALLVAWLILRLLRRRRRPAPEAWVEGAADAES